MYPKLKVVNTQTPKRNLKNSTVLNHGGNSDPDNLLFFYYTLFLAVDTWKKPIAS